MEIIAWTMVWGGAKKGYQEGDQKGPIMDQKGSIWTYNGSLIDQYLRGNIPRWRS